MSSTIPNTPGSPSTAEIDEGCVAVFRKLTSIDDKPDQSAMSNQDLLTAPMESFELDSLSTMEFIMAVEDHFNVMLDEDAVTRCVTIADLSALVGKQLDV